MPLKMSCLSKPTASDLECLRPTLSYPWVGTVLTLPLSVATHPVCQLVRAPYFTAQLLLVPGAFATHLETYTQYANTKGAEALWL